MLDLTAIEEAVRTGRIGEADRELARLRRKGKWSHCEPRLLANLLWRTGSPSAGIRLLANVLVELEERNLRAKPIEAAEYAACLIRVGAFLEADWILGLEEVAATPMAPLYRGLGHVTQWDYARAIPAFQKFIANPEVGEYQLRVGYSNLAAAYVYERRHREATPVLRRLMHDSQLNKNTLMAGFVLEVASADRVLSGDYAEARRFLDESDKRWADVDTYHRDLIEKWNALLALAKDKDRSAIDRVRRRAAEQEEWETLRDCEKYLALWTRDEKLFYRVYFGTPFPAYRERFHKDFGGITIPETYGVELGGEGKRQEARFLIDAAERNRRDLTSQNFALASLLASDLYRPHRLATLYGWLNPEEHFHPDHIGKRMNQAMRRLNAWAEEQQIPLMTLEQNSTYRLAATAPMVLWVPRPGDAGLSWQPLISRLEKQFGSAEFSTGDAMEALGYARSSLVRKLQALVVSGHLHQIGKGRSCRYQLKANAQAA